MGFIYYIAYCEGNSFYCLMAMSPLCAQCQPVMMYVYTSLRVNYFSTIGAI